MAPQKTVDEQPMEADADVSQASATSGIAQVDLSLFAQSFELPEEMNTTEQAPVEKKEKRPPEELSEGEISD